jgi:hypothetical protein
MTPWSTEVEVVAIDGNGTDVVDEENVVRLSLHLSTDIGPMRAFRRFLDVDLDEAHATELLGKLAIALRDLRERAAHHAQVREAAQ